MSKTYIIDACALIAFLQNEPGSVVMSEIIWEGTTGAADLYMHKLNLLEVYYGSLREYGLKRSNETMKMITDSPIQIISGLSDPVFAEAGRLKATYRISLADSIALAEASVRNAALVTSDRHEFDVIEQNEPIVFQWIR